ncbi:MAG: thiamine pyrophosphate enzyme-like TPP-binding protein, partial [Solirubrobacterales bacterium]|nr:thiamine pyrophosphate enzyme-like TPP-binding protein [Solirubrobacterales bacterium]
MSTVTNHSATMSVEDACRTLEQARAGTDALAVLTMSAIAFWPQPRAEDYRLMGLMGSAGAIGLGLALGVDGARDVWVLDGDGSLLMQLGVLAAVADAAPRNYLHLVFDNGIYAISGAQPTPGPVDWPSMFRAAGYAEGLSCATPEELRTAVERASEVDGPVGIAVRCVGERPEYPA